MKILILSVSAGNGHNATASALDKAFRDAGHESLFLDTLNYYNIILGASVDKGYELSVKYSKSLYSMIYDSVDKDSKPKEAKATLPYFFSSIMGSKFENLLKDYHPDAIICTHNAPGMLMDSLKSKGLVSCPIIGINTDFTITPFWNFCSSLDFFIIPSETLIASALRKGISAEIWPLGIPIDESFSMKHDGKIIRKELGLDPELFTVLVMGGSFGFGDIIGTLETLDRLAERFQLICVSGRNAKLKAKVDKLNTQHPLLSLGFATNVAELMDAANCLITKPGGITVSEALAKNLPLILISPIPGQEDRNCAFLLNSGVAMLADSYSPVDDCLSHLLSSPLLLQNMKENIALIAKSDAARRVVKAVEALRDRK